MYFCGLMRGRTLQFILLIAITATMAACSGFNTLLKSDDYEKKYTAALEYYKKKDYVKAGQLFDDLLIAFKGDRRFQEVYFYYAYCKYGTGELILASYHFKNFYESFPISEKAEEALYMHVYCDYLESYPYYLDPTVTRQAMDELQLFVNVFPLSRYVPECNKYMDELRGRLRKKSLESARLYMKMQDYQGAIVAFKNTIKDYPELENKDEVEATLIECQYMLALNSVESKKVERFKEVKVLFMDFEETYGKDNLHYRKSLEYYRNSLKELHKISLEAGYTYYEKKMFVEAAQAFKGELGKEGVEAKDELHYLVVKSWYKAAKRSRNKSYYQNVISEAALFNSTYGLDNRHSKKIQSLKKKAETALQN